MHKKINGWSVVYEQAIRSNGSLFFPERLTRDFLEAAQKTMGAYIYANQYLNIVIPDNKKTFKREWIQYFEGVPSTTFRFIAIDPAISTSDTADYTGIAIVDVGPDGTRYVRHTQRLKVSATDLVEIIFEMNDSWKPMSIAIESVAYQKALLQFLNLEMRRRDKFLPLCEVKPPADKTKEMRILGLVPFFQWGRMLLAQGQHDLELELASFPRGAHDDLLDALCYANEIAITPTEVRKDVRPNVNDPQYESWYRKQLHSGKKPESYEPEGD